jgi:hypothetical protein
MLDMNWKNAGIEMWLQVHLSKCRHDRLLSDDHTHMIDLDAAEEVFTLKDVEYMKKNMGRRLERVKIASCEPGALYGFVRSIEDFPSLTFLRIFGAVLRFQDCNALAHVIRRPRSIQYISIRECQLAEHGRPMDPLPSPLESSSLKSLHLAGNVWVTDEVYVAWVEAVIHTNVEEVNWDVEALTNPISTINKVCQALAKCTRLTKVGFIRMELVEESMRDIANLLILGAPAQLRTMVFHKNNITSQGVKAITHAIKHSTTLEQFLITLSPHIDDGCMPDLIDAIKRHRTMYRILVGGTEVTQPMRKRLDTALSRLHTNRAKVMTVLLAAKRFPRLGSKSRVRSIDVDLLRKLASMLQ